MKKILLATTLLAATAGYAAAEVAVTGTARMGVVGDGDDTVFSSRVRIQFAGTGETDGGLSFGAVVRNDQFGQGGGTAVYNAINTDSTVFISGAFGKLTMGDAGNVVDSMIGQVSGVGFTSLGSLNELAYIDRETGTGAMYEYSAGALSFGIGAGQLVDIDGSAATDDFYSAAVKYSTDMFTVGLGYEKANGQNQTTLFGQTAFSGVTLKAKVADNSIASDTAYALSADYAISGVNATAFFSSDFSAVEAYGVGAAYDLGGGASLKGGVSKLNDGSNATFDMGVVMAF